MNLPKSDRARLDFISALRERGVMQFTPGPMQVVILQPPRKIISKPRKTKKIGFTTEKNK